MFTGIIEEIGTVKQLVPGKVSYRLTISAASVLPTAFLRIKMTEPGFR